MSLDERLRQVFADVFGIDSETVAESTAPVNIDEWDSVGHLNLVLALEGEFSIQFEAEEIPDLVSYGAIRDRLTNAGLTGG